MGAVQVPAIRLPRYPLLQVLLEAVSVADSTILLSCPRIPFFYATLEGMSVADELQELSECSSTVLPDRGEGRRAGKFVHEGGILCAEWVLAGKFVHERGILCAELG